jgi:hypothetical protein
MTTTVRLLGRPEAIDGWPPGARRGQKSWALLALLALSNRPISRQRWPPCSSTGPTTRSVPCGGPSPSCAGRWAGPPSWEAIPWSCGGCRRSSSTWMSWPRHLGRGLGLPGLGETLLAGIDIEASGGFALALGRAGPTDAMAAGHLSEAALSGMADGRLDEAALRRSPRRAPAAGRGPPRAARAGPGHGRRRRGRPTARRRRHPTPHRGARRRAEPDLGAAARAPGGGARSPSEGRASVIAQLDAGEAAVSAGAIEAGLDCLRRACTCRSGSTIRRCRSGP